MLIRLSVFLALALGVLCLVLPEHPEKTPGTLWPQQNKAGSTGSNRSQRQTTQPTRNLGVLQALWQLLFGTARDVGRAVANITDMIQTNLIPTLQLEEDVLPTPPPTMAAPNASTTERPYRITRQEALDLIRRNLYGLVRLYNREHRRALNDSRQNAARADEDLRNALRPYFT